nr:hypothetical protein D3W47_15570 [Deinococcus sp. RM]
MGVRRLGVMTCSGMPRGDPFAQAAADLVAFSAPLFLVDDSLTAWREVRPAAPDEGEADSCGATLSRR